MLDVHIINMNRSKDKWVRCSQRFRDKGFRVYRQEGYDVRDRDLSRYHVGRLQKIGALGCNLSHRALWEKQLLNDPSKNYLVVAEDDAVPLVSSQTFTEQIRRLPQDVDFVHFGCGSRCTKKEPFIGTHCYLVTRAGARKYLAHWKNQIDVPIDNAIGEIPGVHIVHTKVTCATSEKRAACTSDITNTRNQLACILDNIPLYDNKTLGYFLFYPYFGYFNIHDISMVAIISLLFTIKLKQISSG